MGLGVGGLGLGHFNYKNEKSHEQETNKNMEDETGLWLARNEGMDSYSSPFPCRGDLHRGSSPSPKPHKPFTSLNPLVNVNVKGRNVYCCLFRGLHGVRV